MEFQQLILPGLSGVPEELEDVLFCMHSGGFYRVVERKNGMDKLLCVLNGEVWFDYRSTWYTNQTLHEVKRGRRKVRYE